MEKFFILFPTLFFFVPYLFSSIYLPQDKTYLINSLQQTQEELRKNIEEMNETQLEYKSSPEAWSAGQILEHIVVTERVLFGMFEKIMQQPPNPDKRVEIQVEDQELFNRMNDRTEKLKAPEFLHPKSKFENASEALKVFSEQREAIMKFIKGTSEQDLRDRVTKSPLGETMDAYQFLLYITGHCSRHTLQLKELQKVVGFPVGNP
jgi:uncharacterized damage-inducible protein DinB